MFGSKLQNLVSLCALSVAAATGIPEYYEDEQRSSVLRARRGNKIPPHSLPQAKLTNNSDPPSPPINSTVTTLTPQFFTDQGSKRVKVTYGPFIVPSMDINNGM